VLICGTIDGKATAKIAVNATKGLVVDTGWSVAFTA